MKNRFFKTIAGAALLIIVFNVLSRFLGFFREIIFASSFGVDKEFEIYLIAAVFPFIINSILFYLGQNFLIPLYNKTKIEDSNAENFIILQTLLVFSTFSLIIALSLFYFSEEIIGAYLRTNETYLIILAENLFRLLLITIPLSAASSVLSAFFQAKYDFRTPIESQLILNLIFIVVLLLLSDAIQIYAITIAFLIGTLLQLIYLVTKASFLFKNLYIKKFFQPKLYSSFSGALLFTVLIEIIGQMNLVIDRYFFSEINNGGLALLNFSTTIFVLPIALISIGLSLALFPKISEAYYSKNKDLFNKYLSDGIFIITFLFCLITVIFFFFGDVIIDIIYLRGKFGAVESKRAYELLQILTLSLFFYGIYSILYRVYFVINKIRILLTLSLIGLIIKLFFNFILVSMLKENGLALSTSISYISLALLSFFYLIYKGEVVIKISHVKEIFLTVIISMFSLFISNVLAKAINFSVFTNSLISICIFISIFIITSFYLKNRALITIIDSYLPPLKSLYSKTFNQGTII